MNISSLYSYLLYLLTLHFLNPFLSHPLSPFSLQSKAMLQFGHRLNYKCFGPQGTWVA